MEQYLLVKTVPWPSASFAVNSCQKKKKIIDFIYPNLPTLDGTYPQI